MKDDTIKREDAIGAINGWLKRNHFPEIGDGILYLVPSADRPQNVIAQITFDEEKLREIAKEAVKRFKEEYEITDRPQGEWIEMYRNGFGNMICMCSKCSFHASRSRYCPNCGARMKEVDDD